MVFQQDGLFPWMTVGENIDFGLRHVADAAARRSRRGAPRPRSPGHVRAHYPHQLSGGMRQRVELARALGGGTDLLLMDEPFSSLDYLSRLRMRLELARLLREQPRTVVLVTHDIEEAAQLADRVLVLSDRPGRIRNEVRLSASRPRDPTHPEVVRAVHRILTDLGLESDVPARDHGHPGGAVMMRSPFLRWGLGALAAVAVLGVLRMRMVEPAEDDAHVAKPSARREVLTVGFLPVTCHLTCPVTDFASKTSPSTRFESQRFTDFPTVVETIKSGRLDASFMIAPLAMKMREQGVKVKIIYLGHRDGSTVMVRSDLPARSLADLKGRMFAIPSKYSNQNLVIRKLMKDQGMAAGDLRFVEMPPPDMPGALATRAIDAYFIGEPHAARAELDKTGRVLYHAKDIWPHFISCVLVVTERLIAERPAVVRDLVRGIAESGEWAEGHRVRGGHAREPVLPAGRAAPALRADAAARPGQLPDAHADRPGDAAHRRHGARGGRARPARSTCASSSTARSSRPRSSRPRSRWAAPRHKVASSQACRPHRPRILAWFARIFVWFPSIVFWLAST